MTSPIRTERHGDVLVIVSNNPPVNALGAAVRQGLAAAIAEAAADPGVAAMVIRCDGRTFFAGADIKEFGTPPVEPSLPSVIDAIEASDKPVVAAIHGTALGGGCEVALGCHYRVAVPSAKIGTPEVKLGLLPGAGGTQRLPRIAGVKLALEMTAKGARARRWAHRHNRRRGQPGGRRNRLRPRHCCQAPPAPRVAEDRHGRSRRGRRLQEGQCPPLPWL